MPILQFIFILVALAVIMWFINTHVPMQAQIKQILNIAVVAGVLIWIASLLGILPDLNVIRIGK